MQIIFEDVAKNDNFSKKSYVLFLECETILGHFDLLDSLLKKLDSILGVVLLDLNNNLSLFLSEFIKHLNKKEILNKLFVVNDEKIAEEMFKKITHANKIDSASSLIMHAEILPNGKLRVISCDFKKYDIDISNIKSLKAMDSKELKNFEIEKYGSYIYWPEKDVHLDLTSFKAAVDPDFKKKLLKKSLSKNKEFGNMMKAFRVSKGLSQKDFGGDISERQLRRYESGEQWPTFKTFEKISQIFGLSVHEYLRQLEKYVT